MDTQLQLETINPKKAESFLNHNKVNRKLRDGVVEKYAADMSEGRWTQCTVPIVFYDDGDIADGQHRLWAIVESKTTQKFYVMHGLPREAGLNIDRGLGRSIVDNAKISGLDGELTNELLSVGRAFATGERSIKGLSAAKWLELMEVGRDHCEWAVSNGPRGKFLRNNLILSAIARAHAHGESPDSLKRFGEVLTKGYADGEHESAAVTLRNYLLTKGSMASSSALWKDTFLKVQNAIHYFTAGRKLMIIKKVNEEAYPLPKAKQQSVAVKPVTKKGKKANGKQI